MANLGAFVHLNPYHISFSTPNFRKESNSSLVRPFLREEGGKLKPNLASHPRVQTLFQSGFLFNFPVIQVVLMSEIDRLF